MKTPTSPKVESFEAAEAARRTHEDAIRELQDLPAASLRVISNIELADGVVTTVAHKLGRAPIWVGPSAPRNAASTGRLMEYRAAEYDRTKVVALQAVGFGATIVIDLAVL